MACSALQLLSTQCATHRRPNGLGVRVIRELEHVVVRLGALDRTDHVLPFLFLRARHRGLLFPSIGFARVAPPGHGWLAARSWARMALSGPRLSGYGPCDHSSVRRATDHFRSSRAPRSAQALRLEHCVACQRPDASEDRTRTMKLDDTHPTASVCKTLETWSHATYTPRPTRKANNAPRP